MFSSFVTHLKAPFVRAVAWFKALVTRIRNIATHP